MDPARGQETAPLRLLWGVAGARATRTSATESRASADAPEGLTTSASGAVAIVVDVLSFTTTLTVALDRGIEVYPVPRPDASARELASSHDAVLAAPRLPRGSATPQGAGADTSALTLSPSAVRTGPWAARLVLPSPNGATVSHALQQGGVSVVAACLRNAPAVARWVLARRPGVPVTVIASGERWPDGSLRPAVEDLWGAGAVLAHLSAGRREALSPDARAAVAAYTDVRGELTTQLRSSTSGRELDALGYAGDVEIAAEVDSTQVVPVLTGVAFTSA